MPISSRTLFHFVNTLEYLKKILNNDFHPRYCLEKIKTDMTDCVEWYIPMKCFCDIPLSQISEHTKKYGKYGIGLTKNWAMRNGVSPIIYLYENSNTYREINVVHGKILSDAYKKYVKKNSKRTRRETTARRSCEGEARRLAEGTPQGCRQIPTVSTKALILAFESAQSATLLLALE